MSASEQDHGLEQILHSVGDNGRYQSRLFWFFFVPLNFIIPWTTMVQIFQASSPKHWCHVPGRPETVSLESWKNATIPWTNEDEESVHSKCQQFKRPQLIENERDNISDKIVDCQNSWDYDTTWYDETLVTKQNWVCDRQIVSARWISAGRGGSVAGTFIFSYLADVSGRKLTTILTAVVYAVFAIARLYMTTDWTLFILMFVSSMPFASNFDVPWIWVIEQTSIDARARFTGGSFILWTLGSSFLPLLAWLTGDYVLLGIVTSVPFVPVFIVWWFIPESPRWLISRGHVKESAIAFQRIAKINEKEPPPDLENTLQKIAESQNTKKTVLSYLSFLELFKYPLVRKRILLLAWCFMCNVILYWGITYNISNVGGNEFLNFFYLAICELPGTFLGCYSADKFGRRFSEAGSFFLVALTAIITIFVTSYAPEAEIFLIVLCKVCATISFLVIYIQVAEMLPTSHRASGVGFMSIVSATVAISTPYIAYSKSIWPPFPYVIFSFFGSGIATSWSEICSATPEAERGAGYPLRKFWSSGESGYVEGKNGLGSSVTNLSPVHETREKEGTDISRSISQDVSLCDDPFEQLEEEESLIQDSYETDGNDSSNDNVNNNNNNNNNNTNHTGNNNNNNNCIMGNAPGFPAEPDASTRKTTATTTRGDPQAVGEKQEILGYALAEWQGNTSKAQTIRKNADLVGCEKRERVLLARLNSDSQLDIRLCEAAKLHMLASSLDIHKAEREGKGVPLFGMILFARQSCLSPREFLVNHLNLVGESAGLEQVEMFLLGHALGVTVQVVRPSHVGLEDFICFYPDEHIGAWPEVNLVAEDDRHYNVLVK